MKKVAFYEWTCGDKTLNRFGLSKGQEMSYEEAIEHQKGFIESGIHVAMIPYEDRIICFIDNKRFSTR